MRVMETEEFLKQPKGTIFSYYQPYQPGGSDGYTVTGLAVKLETMKGALGQRRHWIDKEFAETSLIPEGELVLGGLWEYLASDASSPEDLDKLVEIPGDGEGWGLTAKENPFLQRTPVYDEDSFLYVVYEEADLEFLKSAVEGALLRVRE